MSHPFRLKTFLLVIALALCGGARAEEAFPDKLTFVVVHGATAGQALNRHSGLS